MISCARVSDPALVATEGLLHGDLRSSSAGSETRAELSSPFAPRKLRNFRGAKGDDCDPSECMSTELWQVMDSYHRAAASCWISFSWQCLLCCQFWRSAFTWSSGAAHFKPISGFKSF